MIKKILSMLLALCMVLGLIPVITLSAVASGTERTTTLDLTSTVLSYTANDSTTKTVDATTKSITDSKEGWSWDVGTKALTLSGVNIQIPSSADNSYGIKLPKGSTIILADGSVNTVTGGSGRSIGLSSTAGLQAAIATGGVVTVKLYDAAGNYATSSVGNPTLTVDYSGSAPIGTASVTGFTTPAIGAVPQAVGALTAGAASYTVTSLTWSPVHSPYAATTAYTATVVLTPPRQDISSQRRA